MDINKTQEALELILFEIDKKIKDEAITSGKKISKENIQILKQFGEVVEYLTP